MMTFEQVMRLNARVTLQQMLQREDFKNRVDRGEPVHLHEIQYPIMQGWDSVMVKADVEIGGTDQLFNILVGRDLQREEGQPQQVVFLMPLLEGLDGVQKMSKSLGNYVGVSEPPQSMFGKLMSISDTLMERYYLLLLGETLPAIHPMDAKKQLAFRIVERYHTRGRGAGGAGRFQHALQQARSRARGAAGARARTALPDDIVSVVVAGYEQCFQMKKSRGDARRLVEQGSVQVRGEKFTDPKGAPALADRRHAEAG